MKILALKNSYNEKKVLYALKKRLKRTEEAMHLNMDH